MNDILLSTDKLTKFFPVQSGLIFAKTIGFIKAVENVSFEVKDHTTFGLVGESGCGKTTISKLLLLLEPITRGSIIFKGTSLDDMTKDQFREYKHSIQAVFQDPYSSLSPRMRAKDIIGEPMAAAGGYSNKDIADRTTELLSIVGLAPESAMMYPHEFSGGQRQRVAVARALSINPKFIVLDEPVSALDVSIQAQMLNLLMDIQQEFGITYLVIAHDLAVVEHISDTIGVMYLGQIIELAPAMELYANPQHPYTQALLAAVPIPDPEHKTAQVIVSGEVPSPFNPPKGCRFHPRCPKAKEICSQEQPELVEVGPGHKVACHVE